MHIALLFYEFTQSLTQFKEVSRNDFPYKKHIHAIVVVNKAGSLLMMIISLINYDSCLTNFAVDSRPFLYVGNIQQVNR